MTVKLYLTDCWGLRETYNFTKVINPKMKVVTKIEFELSFYDVLSSTLNLTPWGLSRRECINAAQSSSALITIPLIQ